MIGNCMLAVQKAAELKRKFKTSDPFVIAEGLGISVRYADSFKQLKGMYTVIARNRFIFLNANNSAEVNRIVCAHELGHDRLHRALAQSAPMKEISLWNVSSACEYEANLFAAELLLSGEEILSLSSLGKSCEQIAAITETDANLVALKVESLIHAGYTLQMPSYENRFLK